VVSNTQETRRVSQASQSDETSEGTLIRLEIYGILILAFALALIAAIVTFDPADVSPERALRARGVSNAIGPIGAHVANLFLGAIGMTSFAVAGLLTLMGVSYLVGRRRHITGVDVMGWLGVLSSVTILLHVLLAPATILGHAPGGVIGTYTGEVLTSFVSTPGTLLVSITMGVVSLIALTRRSFFELVRVVGRTIKRVALWAKHLFQRKHLQEAELDAAENDVADTEEETPSVDGIAIHFPKKRPVDQETLFPVKDGEN